MLTKTYAIELSTTWCSLKSFSGCTVLLIDISSMASYEDKFSKTSGISRVRSSVLYLVLIASAISFTIFVFALTVFLAGHPNTKTKFYACRSAQYPYFLVFAFLGFFITVSVASFAFGRSFNLILSIVLTAYFYCISWRRCSCSVSSGVLSNLPDSFFSGDSISLILKVSVDP